MNLTKQQRVLVAVLGVGVAALVVDKGILGDGPSAAAASETLLVKSTQAATPDKQTGTAPAPERPTISVAEQIAKLNTLSGSGSTPPDPFALPAAWSPASSTATLATPAEHPTFKLTTILRSSDGSRPIAVINGEPYPQGAIINGYELKHVDDQSATLTHDGASLTLRIPTPTLGGEAGTPQARDHLTITTENTQSLSPAQTE